MSTEKLHATIDQAEHLLPLKVAFEQCNPDLLLDVLLDTEAGWGISYRDIGCNAKDSLREKLLSTLALMRSVAAKSEWSGEAPPVYSGVGSYCVPSGTVGSCVRSVIVPFESFELSADGASFIRRLDAKVLDCSKLEDAMNVINDIGGKLKLSPGCDAQHCFEEGSNPYDRAIATGLLQDLSILEDEPWSVTLQRKVWLPPTLCERERYCLLGNIFWALTYTGFFGEAAEKLFGSQCVEYATEVSFDRFDEEYEERMSGLVDLLNYNGWVDSIESLVCVCGAV